MSIKKLIHSLKRWISYYPPPYLTSEGWESFNEEFRLLAPIRYFIYKRVIRKSYIITSWFEKIMYWVSYRTINRYHSISTRLPPGYYEIDVLSLYGCFNMLVDYIEKEQAWHYEICGYKKISRLHKIPGYYQYFYRRPDLGIKQMEWQCELTDPLTGLKTRQATEAIEVLELYYWWKSKLCRLEETAPVYSDQGFTLGPLDSRFDTTALDFVEFDKWYARTEKYKDSCKFEDTDMFVRFVKIRHALWT